MIHLLCSSSVSNVFIPAETVILSSYGWFFGQNPPECKFWLKFWSVMTYKMMHQICYDFYWSIRKWSKLGQQKLILGVILKVFLLMSQDLATWKSLLSYIFVASFIIIAYVVVKLKNFKVFHINPASTKWPLFDGFWALTSPNIVQSCWNFEILLNFFFFFFRMNAKE